MDKDEIIKASKEIFDQFSDTCSQIPEDKFFFQPPSKWSIAQNADHLVRAMKTTRLALLLPKFLIRISFGRPNRLSRSYEELVAKYKFKLEQGGKASGRYLPNKRISTKPSLLEQWGTLNAKYLTSLDLGWTNDELDQYIAPHPLLGAITLRELCYFTIYHTEHHLNIIKTRLSEQFC